EAKASNEVKVEDITEEYRLIGNVIKANSEMDRMMALSEYEAYNSRFKKELKELRTVHDATLDSYVIPTAIAERYLLGGNPIKARDINDILQKEGFIKQGQKGKVLTDLGAKLGGVCRQKKDGYTYTYTMWKNRT
ncbi:hypothetical protein SB749_18720, partial [Brevibacterium sp. SIMBA_078]|uniref:hypothetical protein n=1 Tax=Brevibacterium sp. SIMBA_078 TaxID=3085816 RepID=UPI003978D4EC